MALSNIGGFSRCLKFTACTTMDALREARPDVDVQEASELNVDAHGSKYLKPQNTREKSCIYVPHLAYSYRIRLVPVKPHLEADVACFQRKQVSVSTRVGLGTSSLFAWSRSVAMALASNTNLLVT